MAENKGAIRLGRGFLPGGAKGRAVKIQTSRFGELEIPEEQVIVFPEGLVGLGSLKRFVLLGDPASENLIWLQSVDQADFLLGTLHASLLGDAYRFELAAPEVAALEADSLAEVEVFVILNRVDRKFHANLRGPILINPRRMLGKQVVLTDPSFDVRRPLETLAPSELVAAP